MQFVFDEIATVQAAAYLLKKAGGRMNYTVLLKLLYLADRKRMAEIDSPITGATYYSLPYGPVLSEVLNAIKGKRGLFWQEHIGRVGERDVELKPDHDPGRGRLSRGDMRILDEVFALGGHWDHSTAIRYCHDHVPEWRNPEHQNRKRLPLPPEEMLRALGRTPEEIKEIAREVEQYNAEVKFIEAP
jgi:hypothetical protein